MKPITVYTSPRCTQCDMTKHALTARNIVFNAIDITQNPDALEHAKSLGYTAAPIVITENDHWSGFRPDKIAGLPAGDTVNICASR